MKLLALHTIFLFLTITSGVNNTLAQTIKGLHGEAGPVVAAEVRKNHFDSPVLAYVFYGDLTGAGTTDAIAFLYHPSGGNSDVLTTWIWRDTKDGYVLARAPSIDEVFGVEPRNVVFSQGRIEVTTSVLATGDPRCCPTGKKTFALTLAGPTKAVGTTKDLDVPIMEYGGDGQAANCASSVVTGLKASGDGFLAVRSGPGSRYRKLDELHNGEVVIVYEVRGKWAGVVYRTKATTCSATKTHPITYERKGWVHTNWLRQLAG